MVHLWVAHLCLQPSKLSVPIWPVRLQEPLEPIFDTTELMAEYKDDDSSIQVREAAKKKFFS